MLAPLKHPRLNADAKQKEDGADVKNHLKSPITSTTQPRIALGGNLPMQGLS